MGRIIGGLLVLALCIAGIIGWCMNVATVYGADFSHLTGHLFLRCLGIFPLPMLGAVLGYF